MRVPTDCNGTLPLCGRRGELPVRQRRVRRLGQGRPRVWVLLFVLMVVVASCGKTSEGAAAKRLLGCASSGTYRYETVQGVDPNLTSVDIYTPPADAHGKCADRPLVVWIHGGGWAGGDKSEYMADKVKLFNNAGYVFASLNYRLTNKSLTPPAPQYPVHNRDAAAAVAWLANHGSEIGVDTGKIGVLGHSAGGGITAALSTDQRYLGAHGLPLSTIRCAGSMDGEGYDVTAGATTSPPEWRPTYTDAFGTDPAVWADASPINHVAAGKGIPKFFIAARGTDWRTQQHLAFIAALQSAGVPTTVLDVRALEHADLTTIIGSPNDTLVTPKLMDFLAACFS